MNTTIIIILLILINLTLLLRKNKTGTPSKPITLNQWCCQLSFLVKISQGSQYSGLQYFVETMGRRLADCDIVEDSKTTSSGEYVDYNEACRLYLDLTPEEFLEHPGIDPRFKKEICNLEPKYKEYLSHNHHELQPRDEYNRFLPKKAS